MVFDDGSGQKFQAAKWLEKMQEEIEDDIYKILNEEDTEESGQLSIPFLTGN